MTSLRSLKFFLLFNVFQIIAPVSAVIHIQEIKSPGGLKAWLVEDKTTPVISLSYAFKAGSAVDPKGKDGVAELTKAMLMEGAGELNKQAFAGKLQDLAIDLEYSASLDFFTGTLTTLKKNHQEAARLLNLTLTKPRLELEALKRVKDQQITYLKNVAHNPVYLANLKIMQKLYPNHPYQRDCSGTLQTIPNIKIEDIRHYITNYLSQDKLVIGIAGNLTAQEAGEMIDKVFQGVPVKGQVVETSYMRVNKRAQTIILQKDIPQSTVIFAHHGVTFKDPELLKVTLLMRILGAGDTSRLNEEIREKRGLSYTVGAGLLTMKYGGLVMGSLGTENDHVKESINLVHTEWKRMHDHGVTLKEFNNAKTYLIGSLPLRFTNSAAISASLLQLQYSGKDKNYINERNALINAITLEQINEVAKWLLKPDSLVFVVVGKPVGLDNGSKKSIRKARHKQ
ncbi:MAG: insulinase family protein [Alphaproteobacteria bacterium]|nr:insulinase family protein [Alphaproteobacteria bacterium]